MLQYHFKQMKLQFENNQNSTDKTSSTQEVFQLHFHNNNLNKTATKATESKEVFYTYTDAQNNLNKAFDILFETVLKKEAGKSVDNTKDHDMVGL